MTTKLLFFDEYALDRWTGVRFAAHQPDKAPENPILRPELPWEGWRAFPIANCVMRDDGVWKMWYETGYDMQVSPGQQINRTAYATSTDGLHWERPSLGQVEIDGSRDNSVLDLGPFGVHNVSVVRDDHDPDPSRRYKLSYFAMTHKDSGLPRGINTATSPDGIHWQLARPADDPAFRAWKDATPGTVRSGDTHALVGWVPERGRYVLLARNMSLVPYMFRTIGYSESADFAHWTEPISAFAPDEQDPWGTEFYYVTVTRYEDLYLGVLCVFDNYSQRLTAGQPDTATPPDELAYLNQRLETKLIYSRDLQVWRYASRERAPFIPLGEAGTWDSGMMFGSSLAPNGDEVWAYYGATPMRHIVEDLQHAGTEVDGQPQRMYGGVARLRRDGFVSLRADGAGDVVTKPQTLSGERITLNARTGGGGSVEVTLLGEDGTPLAEPVTFRGDAIAYELDLPTGAGQVARLRLRLHNADIFAVTL